MEDRNPKKDVTYRITMFHRNGRLLERYDAENEDETLFIGSVQASVNIPPTAAASMGLPPGAPPTVNLNVRFSIAAETIDEAFERYESSAQEAVQKAVQMQFGRKLLLPGNFQLPKDGENGGLRVIT